MDGGKRRVGQRRGRAQGGWHWEERGGIWRNGPHLGLLSGWQRVKVARHALHLHERTVLGPPAIPHRLSRGTAFATAPCRSLMRHAEATGAEMEVMRHINPAVDVWQIGCLAYELMCGRPPYGEPTDSRRCGCLHVFG